MARRLAVLTALITLFFALSGVSAEALLLRKMVAPTTACKNQNDPSAPRWKQQRAMRCMTNFARRHAGMSGYSSSDKLADSSDRKGQDIIRCDSFSHYACGRDFTFWLRRVNFIGGCWTAGENIAWGTGELGSARSVFRAWLHSAGHRENILAGDFSQLGVSLRIGDLEGNSGAHVWVQHFGDRC